MEEEVKMSHKRKSPIKHSVKAHTRESGATVRKHERGSGTRRAQRKVTVKRPKAVIDDGITATLSDYDEIKSLYAQWLDNDTTVTEAEEVLEHEGDEEDVGFSYSDVRDDLGYARDQMHHIENRLKEFAFSDVTEVKEWLQRTENPE